MTLYFPKGMLKEWSNIEDIEIFSRSRNWTVNLLPLLMVDEPGQVAYTRISATTPISTVRKEVAVENTIEYLDAWNKGDESIQHDWAMEDKGDALVRFRGAERCTFATTPFQAISFTMWKVDAISNV